MSIKNVYLYFFVLGIDYDYTWFSGLVCIITKFDFGTVNSCVVKEQYYMYLESTSEVKINSDFKF